MIRIVKYWLILCLSFFVLLGHAAVVRHGSAELRQLDELLTKGQFSAAYSLAQQLRPSYEGNIYFDLLYGVAAIRSGHPDVGSFAIERVLIREPNNPRVKLEYGLSQMLLENFEIAKDQFNDVLNTNPPPSVKTTVEAFLRTMDNAQEAANPHKLMLTLGFGTGYDTNVNSSPSVSAITINIPGFINNLSIPLSTNSRARPSLFTDLKPGLAFRYPLGDKLSLFAGVNGDMRTNPSAHTFDTSSATGIIGAELKYKRYTFTVPFVVQTVTLDYHRFLNIASGAFQVMHPFDLLPQTEGGFFIARNKQTYPYTVTGNAKHTHFQDTNTTMGGPLFHHRFQSIPFDTSIKLFYGNEKPCFPGFPHIGRYLFGIEDMMRWFKTPTTQPYLGFRAQRSVYGGVVPGFFGLSSNRVDNELDVSTGIKYTLNKQWMFEPSYTFVRNASNTPIFSYARQIFMVGLTYNVTAL